MRSKAGGEEVAEGPALDDQVRSANKALQRGARDVVDQVLAERSVHESHGRGVLEGAPGDVDTANLEPARPVPPGGEVLRVRLPVPPSMFVPPAPLGVTGVEPAHGDGVAQQGPDRTVTAREVEHPQRAVRVAGIAHGSVD